MKSIHIRLLDYWPLFGTTDLNTTNFSLHKLYVNCWNTCTYRFTLYYILFLFRLLGYVSSLESGGYQMISYFFFLTCSWFVRRSFSACFFFESWLNLCNFYMLCLLWSARHGVGLGGWCCVMNLGINGPVQAKDVLSNLICTLCRRIYIYIYISITQ